MTYSLKKTLAISILVFLTAACNFSDDYHELGSGFSYIGEGGTNHYISGGDIAHNSFVYGNVLKYNSDDRFIIVEQEPSREEYLWSLGADIGADYYLYSDFLEDSAAWKKEQPEESVRDIRNFAPLYKALKHRGTSIKSTEADRINCEKLADSLLQSQPYYQNIFSRKINYWIIDKQANQGYGPYDAARFAQECKRLGINMELEAHYQPKVASR